MKNTSCFFKSIKERRSKNSINGIHREYGSFIDDNDEIAKTLVSFYKNLLNDSKGKVDKIEIEKLMNFKVQKKISNNLVVKVAKKKIKEDLICNV